VGGFGPFVAEQAVALLLASAKNIVGFDRLARAGTLRPVPPTKSLRGRTALILGFGAIAQETARRLAAFGVRIVGMSRTGAPHPLAERMVDPTRLAEAVASADFVVDCLPLTRRTRHLIDASVLRQMKEDAILVNVGRADTIQPEALADHLRAHPQFQAALDVTWGEDFDTGRIELSPSLAGLSNLVLSPHIAGYSEGAREYALERAVENLANFFSGRPLAHVAERADYAREV
ncbi:MAG TPA: NAD(P)-dependent oxidoreductase, partial [Thermoplasmata archaeon]|nr:NAD(P)-dependent oxidoreductase [Thermoplasmata archaeon]